MDRTKIGIVLGILLMGWWVATARAYEPGCIEVASGYQLQKVMATAFGQLCQAALLPDESLVLADCNNQRIIRLQGQTVTTLDRIATFEPGMSQRSPTAGSFTQPIMVRSRS